MKVLALAVAGFAALTAPAVAQFIPRPMAPIGLAGANVFDMVRDMGLDPIGPPMRSGRFWVQRAVDDDGQRLRIVVDAVRAQVLSVEPLGRMPAAYGGPYPVRGPYGYGYGPRPYPYMMPDDEAIAPPRSAMAPRGYPLAALPRGLTPQAGLPPVSTAPKQKSAAVTPGRPPVPRKRPSSAPQEAAGTVEPLHAAPQAEAPVTTGSTPQPAPAKPASPAMTPVAPLE
jgi:hypothetical protein